MDPDAVLHPRGPHSPGVYWRRRLLVLLIIGVLVYAASHACGGSAPNRPTAASGPTPAASRSPAASPSVTVSPAASPSASPSPAVLPDCPDAALKVTSQTDAHSYPPGTSPKLTLVVQNTSQSRCRRDLGSAQLELVVTSGTDRIWSSNDCAPGGSPEIVELTPGEKQTYAVTWDRERSAPGCPQGAGKAQPGTYKLQPRVGQIEGAPTIFVLH